VDIVHVVGEPAQRFRDLRLSLAHEMQQFGILLPKHSEFTRDAEEKVPFGCVWVEFVLGFGCH
jgi:hypothetical protein